MIRAYATSHRGSRRPSSAGFTLLEAMVASVILMVAVAAFCEAVATGQALSADAIGSVRASLLADALLEEILAQPYSDPSGLDNEATRATFDDLDDYEGFSQEPGGISDATGALYPDEYQRFARSVAVVEANLDTPSNEVGGKQVTVTVTGPEGRRWVVSQFVPEGAHD